MNHDTEPTPIRDWLDRWIVDTDTAAMLTGVGAGLLTLSYLSTVTLGPMWFSAMTGTWGLVCLPLGLAIYGWRRFKRWYYPAHYQRKGENDG